MRPPGSDPALSIVIPCFNEAGSIVRLADRVAELEAETDIPFEVIVVDGGSTDGTVGALEARIREKQLTSIRTHVVTTRGGYGHDIMVGLAKAKGEVLAWTHADMQTDPADVLKAYQLFQKAQAETPRVLIKGRRRNRPALDAFFTWGMQLFTRATIGMDIEDINAQPKLFDRDFYETHLKTGAPQDFSLDLFALIQARSHGYDIMTVPVIFADRLHGEAKGGGGGLRLKVTLTKRTIRYILETRARVRT